MSRSIPVKVFEKVSFVFSFIIIDASVLFLTPKYKLSKLDSFNITICIWSTIKFPALLVVAIENCHKKIQYKEKTKNIQ